MHIVILKEYDAPTESFLLGEVVYLLYELLALVILRVRLTGEYDLYRMLRMIDDTIEPFRIPEEKGCPLVGGETTSETDGQGLRGQDLAR